MRHALALLCAFAAAAITAQPQSPAHPAPRAASLKSTEKNRDKNSDPPANIHQLPVRNPRNDRLLFMFLFIVDPGRIHGEPPI